uniref:Uncharacterized protein n=1 Tax=Plectus sambesii TaxID=2011161 RepID=A0A914UI35_9BILA
MLSSTTQDELPMSISTTTINSTVVHAGFGIIDGQGDYDDRQWVDEHKARDSEPRTDLDYSIPSTSSTQPPSSRFDNVHFIELFAGVGMTLILVMLGVLTIYFRSLRQQFRQLFYSHQPGHHSMANQPHPDALDIEECTAFELLER